MRRARILMMALTIGVASVLLGVAPVEASSDGTLETIRKSADRAQRESTARLLMTMEAFGTDFMSFRSDYDLETGDSVSIIEMSLPGSDPVQIESREVDGVSYMDWAGFTSLMGSISEQAEVPFALQDLPPGKRWVRTDPETATEAVGGPIDDTLIQVVQGAVGTPKKRGGEKVGGTPTRHYRVRVDSEKVRKGLDPSQLDFQTLGILASIDKIDVWIDKAGRLRMLSVPITQSGVPMTLSFSFVEFDVPVDVEAPPAEEIAELEPGAFGQGTAVAP